MNALKLCKSVCPNLIPVISENDRISGGADGEVYNLLNCSNKVIKMSVLYQWNNIDIYDHYRSSIEKLLCHLKYNNLSIFASVYDYQYLGEYSRKIVSGTQKYILYYYIMEKLNKLSEDESKVFHTILSHEDNNIVKNFSLTKIKNICSGLRRGLDFDEKRIIMFCSNLRKSPVLHKDIHPRNILKNSSGDFKLVDFDRCELK